ncbi:MAG: biotin synthase BioB [Succinivibrio sp.]|nr:biotin synthase BioB [Succinivibrio sp.]
MQLNEITQQIIQGYLITPKEAAALCSYPLDRLCASAASITRAFFANQVELCSISNAKCGRCTEDCKFCAQSIRFKTEVQNSPLKSCEQLFEEAKSMADQGVQRFSLVTAGVRLSRREIEECGKAIEYIRAHLNIECCVSLGLLKLEDFLYLKSKGVSRMHCNLETSERFFPEICSTHTFEDKLSTLAAAKAAGLEICSGCIIGMGESLEDRQSLAFSLREVGACSVPVNILNPIKGTPLERQPPLSFDEIKQCIALFRHILPRAVLRLAGGRILIKERYAELYDCGVNALITGDMLTTSGLGVRQDQQMLSKLSLSSALIPPKFKEI